MARLPFYSFKVLPIYRFGNGTSCRFKSSMVYNKIIIEVMGGDPKSNDIEKQNKIMKNIAKVMTIDKQRT